MMGVGTKTCPRCAEHVKAAAKVCRYCGHEFGNERTDQAEDDTTVAKIEPVDAGRLPRPYLIGAMVLAAILLVVVIGWAMSPTIRNDATKPSVTIRRTLDASPAPAAPAGPELAVGRTLEWSPETAPPEAVRQVGTLVVRVTRKVEDDMVAPVVTVSRGDESVVMTGELVGPTYTHRISSIRNLAWAGPVVMLQSFSGGAHCCNRVQLAGLSGGRMKVVDLGSWDGDEMGVPTDLNGDGVADFVERDNAFLYAFAAYAMSYAPPTILNVTGGRVVDVSRRRGYRRLYLDEMAKAGETCRTAEDGMDRNGACPSYVASAARVGRLDEAWADMVRSYSATEDWEYPTGCTIKVVGECPEASRIVYKSYPEALLAFLKEHGYVATGWTPSDAPMPDGNGQPGEDQPT